MAFAVSFDTYVFTDDVEEFDLDDDTDIPTEKVPRRHGVYVNEEPTRAAKTVRVVGSFFKSTAANAVAELDTLLRTLNQGVKQLKFNSGRYANAYKQRFSYRWLETGDFTVVRYEVEFLLADPFWYDVTATSTTITSGYAGWTHNNGGDELVYPVIQITAAGGGSFNNATMTNSSTGKSWTYAGTVAAGAVLEVDCANFTCENPNGTSDMANFSGTFFWLVRGNNSLVLTYSGTAPASVNIAYNRRRNCPDVS